MRKQGFRRLFAALRGDLARAVDEELRTHIEMKARDLEKDGLPPDRARHEATRRFGDMRSVSRECRRLQAEIAERRTTGERMDTLWQDLKFAVRAVRRNPAFSIVAVFTLALGIGANAAIFSVINGVLIRPLPGIVAPERLVEITQGDGDDFASLSYPIFAHVRQAATTLDDIAAFDVVSMAVGGSGAPEVCFGLQVTGNYFDVLGTRPALGRFFDPQRSFPPDVEDAVVISHDLWERRFGADPGVIGRAVTLNGYPAVVIGVTPSGFGGHVVAIKADIFVPIGMPAPEMLRLESLQYSRNSNLETVARLAPQATPAAAGEEVAALANAFIQSEEGPEAVFPLQTTPYGAIPGSIRGGAKLFFAILMASVTLLLVITCVNVANMMLSRGNERAREIAVRLSIGASRRRLMRQLLTESLVLAGLAATVGVVLSVWLTGLLAAFEPPVLPFPGLRLGLDFGVDGRVLGYALLMTCFTALLFGLAPAWRATRPRLVSALKSGRTRGFGRTRGRNLLLVAQMAATIVLLVGSGLFLRALQRAQSVDTGFRVAAVYVAGFDVELNGYDEARAKLFYDELVRRAGAVSGVDAAAIAGKLPLAGASSSNAYPQATDAEIPEYGISLHNQSVSSGYFQTLGLPLLRGRSFGPGDGADAPMVAVINRSMAERYWSIDNAVGQVFEFRDTPVEVIGVVGDAKYHALVEDVPDFAYFSFRQRPRTDMILHMHATPEVDPAALWSAVRGIVTDLDPEVPLLSAAPLADALRIHFFPQLFAAWITGVVGAFGLLLGAVGIYGVTAYAASRRAHEIGVRIALGADLAEVRRMMVRQGMVAPLLGIGAGLVAAAALTRLLSAFLVGVSPLDAATFTVVAGLLGGIALLATLVPAIAAARVDPVVTLRSD